MSPYECSLASVCRASSARSWAHSHLSSVSQLDLRSLAKRYLPRRFGEQHDQSSQDESRNNLTAERYAPLLAVTSASPSHVATVANPGGEDLTKSVEQLLETSNSASNAAMGNLRLIDWYDHSQNSDSDACDKTADVKHCDHNAGSLNDAADNEDATCRKDSATTTKTV
jgi:hypothetical protein